jgi:hypothetical protein
MFAIIKTVIVYYLGFAQRLKQGIFGHKRGLDSFCSLFFRLIE